MKEQQLKHLDMFWSKGIDYTLPHEGEAILYFVKKNRSLITWNCLTVLENNPATLPQTETILKGQSVGGISIDEMMQVKHYGDALQTLITMLKDGTFTLSIETTLKLHAIVAKEEALTWGELRNKPVGLHGITAYSPPHHAQLQSIADKAFPYLNSITSIEERAIATFLFMSRTQFFFDVNKRTASLMMNGILLQAGLYPIVITSKEQDSEEFNTKLSGFYESGDASEMMAYFEKCMTVMYSDFT